MQTRSILAQGQNFELERPVAKLNNYERMFLLHQHLKYTPWKRLSKTGRLKKCFLRQ